MEGSKVGYSVVGTGDGSYVGIIEIVGSNVGAAVGGYVGATVSPETVGCGVVGFA